MGWLWADDSADARLTPTQALLQAADDGPTSMGEAGPLSTDAIPLDELKARAGELKDVPPPNRRRR